MILIEHLRAELRRKTVMSDQMIYKTILENLPDGLVVADENDEIIFVNSAAEEIRHIKREEKIGQNIINCHKTESHEKVKRAIVYLKEKEKSFKRMVIDNANGKVYENIYQIIANGKDLKVGSIVLSRDITEKHRVEEENLKYNQKLKLEITGLTDRLNSLFIESLNSLVYTLEAKDIYTKGHSERVTKISTKYVQEVYGQSQLYADIELAAKLHDIGKIGVNEAILNKVGKLTKEEIIEMQRHPTITAQILSPFLNLKEVIDIAKHHHERYDGNGYPDRQRGDEINIGSRILALADTYDAITSTRSYRKALNVKEAIDIIYANLGTQFDPKLGKTFLELVESGTL